MKNLIYLVFLLLTVTIFSFSTIINTSYSSATSIKKTGTCPAPTGLVGTLSGTSLTLDWSPSSGVTGYSYGGTLSPNGSFNGTTTNTTVTITVPSGTTGGTFRVNALCSDGTSSVSDPRNF